MRLRIRSKDNSFVISLPDESTLNDLFRAIEEETKQKGWKVFHQFPPVELPKSQSSALLRNFDVKNAETLTIESTHIDLTQNDPIEPEISPPKPQIILKEIPDDNSCLFNAIGYLLENHSLNKAQELRSMIGQYILARPLEYSEAVLGKSSVLYADWIQKSQSWGGAIELSIFSDIYKVEIASFDVQSGRMYLFGEGKGLRNRIYIQYTGIHYEAFVLSLGERFSKETEVTVFDALDDSILLQVQELVNISRQSRRFTDLSGFTLRCEICKSGFKGQLEAQRHANETGHASFVEY